ncbi:MAG TPA: c-type cytochrome [Burkholderiales bacterium]|nr:c-type cytochrome [Burkholderiales bacterium]
MRYPAKWIPVAFALAAGGAHAASDVFAFGDPKQGEKLYEQKCAACHVAQFGGDGSSVFTRSDRRIHTAPALLAQVQFCNTRSRAGLSAEGEQSVAAWLNEKYYKFK